MKKIIIIIFIVFAVMSVNAKLLSIEVSPSFAHRITGFDDQTKAGYGFRIAPNIHLLGFMDITAGFSYLQFQGAENAILNTTYSSIPVFAGIKIYPFKFMGIPAVPGEPFFYIEPGVNILGTETSYFNSSTSTDNSDNLTGVTGGVGYRVYPGKFGLNLKADYNYFTGNQSISYFGLSIGLLFTVI